MTKIISLYNNKGGVSKTTTTFNLAVYLSQQGKRVLIADCDPQCNVTELFFASRSDLADPDTNLPGTSIYQALLPRFKGQQSSIDATQVEIVEHNVYRALYLFRGDLEFSLAETYLGTSWNQAVTENIHEKNTYVVLNNLLRSLGAANNYDYILCDIGPSTGAITRNVILCCDEIIIPLVPDRFCFQAIKLLGMVISEWIKKHQTISETLVPFGIEPFEGKPRLAGTVLQNFKVHAGSRVKESYIKWQTKITEEIRTSLCKVGGFEPKEGFNLASPYTASIKDVAVLSPIAQIHGRAIFDIQQEHTKDASSDGKMYYGSVWQPWVEKMRDYKSEIAKLSDAIS